MKIPENFKLTILDVGIGERQELKDEFFGVEFYMRVKAHHIIKEKFGSPDDRMGGYD